ncbi:hypothetical protein [Scopulibacillus cellulosilyticus]|uniref:Uncharacterized protein n=1 Tax=Scopulibacillus cellulosilyticus TaxID=2665665 RepID=A0ABW2Q1B0_9BACL
MIFSEWDEITVHQDQDTWKEEEPVTHQDLEKEKEALNHNLINENDNDSVLLLLEIAKQLNKCITNLEEEYGTKAAKLAETPFNRLIHHILDVYDGTSCNINLRADYINNYNLNYV